MKFDVVIVGAGLGGLQCAYILSQEGYNVCLLEKNSQLGGCLQTFRRNNVVFDTGMHYIGSMDEGQMLNKLFRYFGLTDKLKLKRMDENGYEIIQYNDREYKYAMGFDRFNENMQVYFPNEVEALMRYTDKMKEISESADLYKMRESFDRQTGYLDNFSIGINDYINSITSDQTLKNVLLAIAPSYSGVKNKTPMYIPMVILSSYISSAYRFVGGGSQVSDLIEKSIKNYGCTIMRKAEVTAFIYGSDSSVTAVEINNSEKIEGKYFISNIHPKTLLRIAHPNPFRPAYNKRINGIDETAGIFTLYMAMKENAFEYINSNYYVLKTNDVWEGANYSDKDWPKGYMMHISPGIKNEKYTDAIIVITYMKWEEVAFWENTSVGERGADYAEFKQRKAEKLLDVLEIDFPGIRSKTDAWYTSTPLTYRDYIGSPTGSLYGLLKDYNDPLRTMVLPRTTIPNLFFTGQNINIHGVIGVTICSILTCSEFLGSQYLLSKIRNA